MWPSENAGSLDWNSELELWTKAGHIKVKLAKGADMRRIDSLIAWAMLNNHCAHRGRPWFGLPRCQGIMAG